MKARPLVAIASDGTTKIPGTHTSLFLRCGLSRPRGLKGDEFGSQTRFSGKTLSFSRIPNNRATTH